MIDKLKVINFLQDFGCASLSHLQKLNNAPTDNFKNILFGNVVSKKGDVFVHNTKKIDDDMLVALDILCKYKDRLTTFHKGYYPINITFLSRENLVYHIIVANNENKKGIVKHINNISLLPKADKLILAFPDDNELENINCELPFLYCKYPKLEIIN